MAKSSNVHDDVSASKEESEYFSASNVNVANFVSVKLSGQSNYHIWKAQMLSLLDHLIIRDIVENRENWLKSKSADFAKKYDILLKGWILGSLSEEALKHLDYSADAQTIWVTLANEYCFRGYPTVKLSGCSNYHIWKTQMLSLMDELMIRWILGSVSEEVLRHLDYSADAQSVWVTLEDEYCLRGNKIALAFKLYKLHLESTERSTNKVLMAITRNFPSDVGIGVALIYPSWENACKNIVKRSTLLFYSFEYLNCHMLLLVPIAVLYPLYQLILLFISLLLQPFYMLYALMWKVLATVVPIMDIEQRKKEYEEVHSFLDETVRHMDGYFNFKENLFYRSLFYSPMVFEAVRLDEYEVLRLVIHHFNQTIQYTTESHNIIQLAIRHRSEKVYNHIFYPLIKQKKSHRVMTDYSGNNLLHLVGKLAPSDVLSRTTGAALQLQRELQRHKEVKKFMEPMQLNDLNADDETPDMVFTREHANLVKDGEKWLKGTAESCIITAALIVTIVFAAAITVPGGSNQETGIPLFRKQIAFTVFAISDAFSVFSAATSLAILFLVFCDQRLWVLAPIGVSTCMPITAIVTLQLPLVVELYRSTYSSRFEHLKTQYFWLKTSIHAAITDLRTPSFG
uniref:PGG domain-containing protein n=1 Tax=Tanacetum cinerariifolium TaxID=118510 RepID=A0A699IJM5_TANCI|nr:hypothetical protein [Tanacetum cinerariifolium]